MQSLSKQIRWDYSRAYCVRNQGSERPSVGDVVWEFVLQLQEIAEKNKIIDGDFLKLCLEIIISFQIVDFNCEIIKKEFENDKIVKSFSNS